MGEMYLSVSMNPTLLDLGWSIPGKTWGLYIGYRAGVGGHV